LQAVELENGVHVDFEGAAPGDVLLQQVNGIFPVAEQRLNRRSESATGDMVYWRVEACNENGCTNKTSSFGFMP
jgi:hypothetical protein